ncbi:MAG: hypothetical protein D3924_08015, partial [Candidatus Electrothrix sp. AR4]|nr:hypothetical protein [Candidatus Electrothrix sp. AR4]
MLAKFTSPNQKNLIQRIRDIKTKIDVAQSEEEQAGNLSKVVDRFSESDTVVIDRREEEGVRLRRSGKKEKAPDKLGLPAMLSGKPISILEKKHIDSRKNKIILDDSLFKGSRHRAIVMNRPSGIDISRQTAVAAGH